MKSNPILKYRSFRECGMSPVHALSAAKTLLEWESLEYDDRVRLRAEHEQENYFDVFGQPDGYVNAQGHRVSPEQERKEICESIERYGNYYIVSEYFDGEEWQHADSIGMCAGYRNVLDPRENWYVPDLMAAAIKAYRDHEATVTETAMAETMP